MSMKSYLRFILLLWGLLVCCCDESEKCPCVPGTIDPPMSDLSVTWMDGSIWANLMPIVLPDPIGCNVWLILENNNPRKAFSKVEIPSADVVLARSDSTLGTIPVETDWGGYLAAGERDTVYFFKHGGDRRIFDPPCAQQVLMEFLIRNADGDSVVFEPDTLTFVCVF